MTCCLRFWCLFFYICLSIQCAYTEKCPCANSDYCRPISRKVQNEVFVFSLSNATNIWLQYDWTKITTIVTAGLGRDPELMCIAHKYGARIVYLADYPLKQLGNETFRLEFVQQNVQITKRIFYDGINLDFESPISRWKFWLREDYTKLVTLLYTTFKTVNPNYQVTIDIPYSPDCIYGRCYDYRALSSVTDFMVVMAYDEWDRSKDKNLAGAVNSFVKTKSGLAEYSNIPVPADKLLLAVPWYGDWFPCASLSKDQRYCNLGHLQGVAQIDYSMITQTLLKNSTSGRRWDKEAVSPYFNLNYFGNYTYQLWYDDPESLAVKYKLALDLDLRGVGMWHADCIHYDVDPQGSKVMWAALPRYNNTF